MPSPPPPLLLPNLPNFSLASVLSNAEDQSVRVWLASKLASAFGNLELHTNPFHDISQQPAAGGAGGAGGADSAGIAAASASAAAFAACAHRPQQNNTKDDGGAR